MKDQKISEYEKWFNNQRHYEKRIRGNKFSYKTFYSYKRMLLRIPDFDINNDKIIILKHLQKFIDEYPNFTDPYFIEVEGKIIATKPNKMVYDAVQSYLRFLEKNIDIREKIRYVREQLSCNIIYSTLTSNEKTFISKTLTKEDIRNIINAQTDKRMKMLISLMYETGCRVDELAHIYVNSINLSNRTILIKGKFGYMRYVFYTEDIDSELKEFIKDKIANETLFGFKTKTIQKYVKSACIRTGNLLAKDVIDKKQKLNIIKYYKAISCHWFRHSRATHLAIIWKGDMRRLKDFMGWSSIMMADIYVNTTLNLLKKINHYKSEKLWED